MENEFEKIDKVLKVVERLSIQPTIEKNVDGDNYTCLTIRAGAAKVDIYFDEKGAYSFIDWKDVMHKNFTFYA